ncbi:MAG TPA: helix-turn-helix domain-containing protein [Planctomycetota bacterium]|nr:helix-turn-helix domain-containing protein [Planctomycetota bacterium]
MSDYSLSAELFTKVRTLRKLQGLSAQALADRMTAQGFHIIRSVVANGEIGRVRSMSVDFADHSARALGLTLTQLITDPAVCTSCKGEPPAGFTCNTCGQAGGPA